MHADVCRCVGICGWMCAGVQQCVCEEMCVLVCCCRAIDVLQVDVGVCEGVCTHVLFVYVCVLYVRMCVCAARE